MDKPTATVAAPPAPRHPDATDPAHALAALRLRVRSAEALASAALVALEAAPILGHRDGNRAYLLVARLADDLGALVEGAAG